MCSNNENRTNPRAKARGIHNSVFGIENSALKCGVFNPWKIPCGIFNNFFSKTKQLTKNFQRVRFFHNRKCVYFTLDSIIAGAIILIVILLASSFYVEERTNIHLSYLSRDLIGVLSTTTVEDIDNDYINERISTGDITNLENTVLNQIAEFWADNEIEFANKTVQNVTLPWITNTTGFGMWIENESIYQKNVPIEKSLVSSKKIISGITKGKTGGLTRQNPPTLYGPVVVEVRAWQ